ncbi:MAG: hypothetical protein RTU63_10290 [Candidatus Thorarchaeota archaeon]
MFLKYRDFDGSSTQIDVKSKRVIDLRGHNIRTIDVSQLAGSNVRKIFLDGNHISRLDITSLFFCPNLEVLQTDWSTSFDALYVPMTLKRPLALELEKLKEFRLGGDWGSISTVRVYWKFSNLLVKGKWNQIQTQVDLIYPFLNDFQKHELKSIFLEALNLHHYLGVDTLFHTLFESADSTRNYNSFRNSVKAKVEELLLSQVRNGGPTIFIDVESIKRESNLLPLAAEVLEKRTEEMQNLEVYVNSKNRIDLRTIWITAYGFRILRGIGAGLDTNLHSFERIHDTFKSLGYSIQLKKRRTKAHDSINLSDGIRNYILFIADRYRNRYSPI